MSARPRSVELVYLERETPGWVLYWHSSREEAASIYECVSVMQ